METRNRTETQQWWIDSANRWLEDPRTDPGLLYTAAQGLGQTDPELARRCLEQWRKRRK